MGDAALGTGALAPRLPRGAASTDALALAWAAWMEADAGAACVVAALRCGPPDAPPVRE
jgi:hypothetical protein